MESIYEEERKAGKPRIYFYTQIKSVQIYYQSNKVQWMDLKIEYENHERKVNYEINEVSHEANHNSF